MLNRIKREKRLHPRLPHELPVYIAANGYDFTTTTQNISCTGAYCRINRYVPPFTKIAIKMSLPSLDCAKYEKSEVECKGVIVRTDDEAKGGFNIAIFFNEIKGSQKKKISQYINQLLPQWSA